MILIESYSTYAFYSSDFISQSVFPLTLFKKTSIFDTCFSSLLQSGIDLCQSQGSTSIHLFSSKSMTLKCIFRALSIVKVEIGIYDCHVKKTFLQILVRESRFNTNGLEDSSFEFGTKSVWSEPEAKTCSKRCTLQRFAFIPDLKVVYDRMNNGEHSIGQTLLACNHIEAAIHAQSLKTAKKRYKAQRRKTIRRFLVLT